MNVEKALFLFLTTTVLLSSCRDDKNKHIPDVSNIAAKAEIKRFERDLFQLDTLQFAAGLQALEAKYPEFATIYFEKILGSRDSLIAPEGHEAYMRGFVTHESLRKLYDTCQIAYPDLKQLEQSFSRAFQFYKYYFPEQPLSGEVVTFISEYTLGGFLYGENSIGVGLDFYLGDQYPYQQYNPSNPNFSRYLTRTFNADHLVSKSMSLLVDDLLGTPSGNRLIDYMIHNGKELYLLDKLLPEAPDSVKLEYAQAQLDWCEGNESNIWAFLLEENLIFSTDWGKFRKLVEPSPSSPGMPAQAPGRTASWLGFQIVKAFMEQKPETTLQELIALRDAQAILDLSKYKPRRK
jgi:hypothetical protein